MQFEEFGISLRELRDAKGLTQAEAATIIKLSARTLEAIENGQIDDLPHPVYAKGFIRTYAKYLGMSDEQIAEAFSDIFPPVREDNTPVPPPVTYQRRSSKVGPVLILLLLAILAVGFWYFYSNIFAKSQEQPVVPVVSSEIAPPAEITLSNSGDLQNPLASDANATKDTPFSLATNATISSTATTAAATSGAGGASGTAPDQNTMSVVASNIVAGEAQSGQVEVRNSTNNSASPRKHRVVITATEECWVKATTDAGDERPFNLAKNQSTVFTFDRFLKLRLGNALGVKIRYNGADFPLSKEGGATRDLVFPPGS